MSPLDLTPLLAFAVIVVPFAYVGLPALWLCRPSSPPCMTWVAGWGLMLGLIELIQLGLFAAVALTTDLDTLRIAWMVGVAGVASPVSFIILGRMAAKTADRFAASANAPVSETLPSRPRLTHLSHLFLFTAESAVYCLLVRTLLKANFGLGTPVAATAAVFAAIWFVPPLLMVHFVRPKSLKHYVALAIYFTALFMVIPRSEYLATPAHTASILTTTTLIHFSIVIPFLFAALDFAASPVRVASRRDLTAPPQSDASPPT